jgi:AraC-like DNA-binding protein
MTDMEPMARVETLFSSPLVQVQDVCCTMGRSGLSATKGDAVAHLCMVRRGCFHYHLGRRTYFADASRALIHDDGVEYRTSHPCDGGDNCTVIVLTPELMVEAFGRRRRHEEVELDMAPVGQVSHLAAYALLRHPDTERLAGEETAIGLVQAIAAGRRPPGEYSPADAERLRIVRLAKALLNERLDENLSLSAVACEAGCSPYHLMHLFRSHSGQTIRGYRARLRVAAALDLMVQGAWDLTDLALQCGFSSHSHMSETFRAVLGMAPSELRQRLSTEALQEKRSFVQAALERAA